MIPPPEVSRAPALELGPLPSRAPMRVVDERLVRSSPVKLFQVVREVERWPELLPHYRFVRFRERHSDGGGVVEMAAVRRFGFASWPTWWLSEMQVVEGPRPAIRFRHIAGVTRGMEVEWSFTPEGSGSAPAQPSNATRARIVHLWNGPPWPIIGGLAAVHVIGPMFIHWTASRTLAGLGAAVEAASSGDSGRKEEVMSKGRTIGANA